VPEGAPKDGHGYVRYDDDTRQPLWAVRTLPGADGSVRLGYLSSRGGALVGALVADEEHEVDEYEVLLDQGTWLPSQEHELGAAGALAAGRLADGTPLYFALDDPWGEGARAPLEFAAGDDWHYPRQVLMAAPAVEGSVPSSPAEPDATGYRWAPASGGEIPDGAHADGHGSMWSDGDDGDAMKPLWLIRARLPDGSVQLGYVARGGQAQVGTPNPNVAVDEYEVLLDAGEWRGVDYTDTEDDSYFDYAAEGAACGRLADGSPVYATVRDREGEGYEPGGNGARGLTDFNRKVLVAPAGAVSGMPAPAKQEAEAPAPAAPEPVAASASASAAPTVIVRALDLRGEVVEIANAGDAPVDLGGWRLHDEGSTKGFVFPAGTVLAAGASVRVRSGPGAAKAGPGELRWKSASVWNDKGDTAYLKDPAGELVASMKA
jgi:hypothetical protein